MIGGLAHDPPCSVSCLAGRRFPGAAAIGAELHGDSGSAARLTGADGGPAQVAEGTDRGAKRARASWLDKIRGRGPLTSLRRGTAVFMTR